MKIRLISALIVLLIFIPICIIGGTLFNITIYAIALLGLKEFMDIKCTKKTIPLFVKAIAFIFLTLIILTNTNQGIEGMISIDYRIVCGLFLLFLMPTVLYHDRTKYSINDAFYLIGGIFFLSISIGLMITIRNISLLSLMYLFIITITTDTFAYINGRLIGKHKLLECISPNKTWEGTIAGSIYAVFIATMFYITVINPNIELYKIVSITLFLSLIGQFGDLVFSNIKRYFKVKDFSNIMPGHGGVLDRIDSITFVLLGYMFFTSIL